MARLKLPLTGPLARAARALIEVSSSVIAEEAGIPDGALIDFERGLGQLGAEDLKALRAALEKYGAFFVADGKNGRGYGVRLKFSSEKARRVESWEGEGGFAAPDEV